MSSWLALTTILTVGTAHGASLYWDTDASTVGNNVNGTGLGGTGTWDTTIPNWWDETNLVVWPNTSLDEAIFSGSYVAGAPSVKTVTISSGVTANRLTFRRAGYVVTGGTLTLAGTTPALFASLGESATISSIVAGSDGLTKTGSGSIRLGNALNSYIGATTISNGSLVIGSQGALGGDTTTVVVTGSAARGFGGGSLVLDGTSGTINFARGLSLQGLGPITDRGAALVSVGSNTLSGAVNMAVGNVNTRLVSANGLLTISNSLDVAGTAATTLSILGGVNQAGAGQYSLTGALTGSGTLEKNGSGTLFLTPSTTAGFSGTIRVGASATGTQSSVRITTNNVLGSRTAGTTSAVLDLNAGLLEVRMDAPLLQVTGGSNANVYVRGNGSSMFLDHSVGGSAVNGTANFGNFSHEDGAGVTFTSRNGYSMAFTTAPVSGADGNSAFANNLAGLLSFTGNFWSNGNNTAARTMTISGNGNTLINGNVIASAAGFNHILAKTGSGILTIMGTGSTLDGAVSVQGSLAITDFRSIGNNTESITLGNTTSTAGNLIIGTSAASSATHLVANRPIILNGTTASNSIYANQAGSFPVILNGAITKPLATTGSLILGGTSVADNTINAGIPNNGTGGLTKVGSGTWVLAAANTYVGATTIADGTLKLKAFAAASDLVPQAVTNTLVFNADATTQSAGGTLEFIGVSGSATTETLGALTTTAGMGTVRLSSGGAGAAANLIFTSAAAPGKAGGVNFVTTGAAGGTVTLTGVATSTATTLPGNGHFYIDGADFARSNGGVLVAPVYGTDAGFVTAAGGVDTLTAGSHNLITGDITSQVAVAVTSLKLTTNALTLAGDLTVNTGGVANDGGILVTGGSTASISGGALTTGGAGTLVFRVDSASDVLTLNSPMLVGTTGGFTKNGAGTLILTGNNLQVGATTINEGTVRLSGTGRLSGNSTTSDLALRQGAVLDLNGVNSDTAISELNGAGTITNGSSAATTTLQLGNSNGTGTFTGLITNGTGGGTLNVTKVGTGAQSWLGTSSYTGITTIGSTGLVTVDRLADIGVASGIGAGNAGNNAGSLVFNGSTGGLVYQGGLRNGSLAIGSTSASTDRLFTLSGTGATLSSTAANGNAIVWSNTGAIVHGVVGPQALTFTGTSTGDNTFNPQITDSGTLLNITSVTKAGAGQWNLGNSNNTYTGTTRISEGILGLNDSGALSTNSPLALGTTTTSGILQMSGSFIRNLAATPTAGTGTVTWTGTTGSGGFAAHATQLTVTLNNDGVTPLVWGSGGFVGTGGIQSLLLNSTTALSDVVFANAINLGTAQRTVNVADNGNTGADFATMSGDLTGTGAGGIQKTGTGILRLTGANSYTGITDVNAGTLVVTSIGNSGSPASTATSVGVSGIGTAFDNTNAITLGNATTGGATLQYAGAGETSDRKIRLNSTTGGAQIHADGSGALILTNVANDMVAGNKTLSLRGTNTAGNMITNVLSDNGVLGVTVDGGATWILTGANTYTGTTSVSAGALGLGSNTAIGIGGNLDLASGTIFAYGEDRTIANPVRGVNNTGTAVLGDYSLSFSSALQILAAANGYSLTNNLVAGKSLTFTGATANSLPADGNRAFTVDGAGLTFIDGNLTTTQTSAGGLNLTKNGTGTLILGGAGGGANNFNRNNAGLTVDRGILRLAASEVIGDGVDTQAVPVGYGGVTLAPDLVDGDTATLDLNGNTETINGLTATTDGTAIIDNTSSSAASLVFGANNAAVSFGTGAGTYSITDSGTGALSITKTGSGIATLGGGTGTTTLTYEGATNVYGGTLNVAAVLNGTTSIDVENGSTLNLTNGAGNPLAVSTFSIGTSAGATLGLELGASNALSDTLTASGVAAAGNTITFNITGLTGFGSVATYDLLTAAATSGLDGATYSVGFAPGGYTYSFLESDTAIQLSLTALAAGDFYWTGNATTQSWSNLIGGNSNFSTTSDGLTEAGAAPGALNTVNFSATNAGGAAKTTTLDNAFSIAGLNILSAVAGNVTIASGTGGALSSLTIGAGGIDVQTGAPALTTISAPVVLGANQIWNVADVASNLTVSGAVSGVSDLTKNGAGTLALSGDFTGLTGDITINAGVLNVARTGTFTVPNLITGAGALTKSAAGIMTLSNDSNDFTGPVTITGGTLAFTTIGNVGGGATSMGAPTTALDGTITIAGTLSFAGSTNQATDRLITQTGSATYSADGTAGATITYNGAISAGTSNFTLAGTAGSVGIIAGGITQTDDAADATVSGGTWTHQTGTSRVGDVLTATGASTILNLNSGLLQVRNDFVVTTGANLNLNGTGVLSFSTPTLSADASLRAVSNGVITLGANDAIVATDFDGLRIGTDAAGTGTLNMSSFNQSVSEFILGNRNLDRAGLVLGTGVLTVTGNFDLYGGTINAGLASSGANGLEKYSLNTVTLAGNNSGLAGTAATIVTEGTLILDYTTSNTTKVRAASALDMRGSNLTLNGNASAGTNQSVASFTLASGGSNIITLNPGVGQQIVLNLNTLTRGNVAQDGTVRFVLPSGVQSGLNGFTTTSPNSTFGLLGTGATSTNNAAYATVTDATGTWFATASVGNIVRRVSTAKNNVATWATGEHITDTIGGFTGTLDCADINSLRFDAAVGSDLVIGQGKVLRIGSGGILVTSNVGGTPSMTGGSLISGATEIVVTQDSAQTFELGSSIGTNHALTKTGNGVLRLSGNNSFSGNTEIQQGTLQVSGGNAIGDTSIVTLSATRATTLQLLADETIGRLQGGSRNTDQDLGTVAVGTNTLTINNSGGNTTYAGFFTGTGGIVKQGTSNLNLTNVSTGFTGVLSVDSSLVQLSGIGQINASTIRINKGGNLLIDNNGTTRSGTRILDTATVILNSADGAFAGTTAVRGLAIRTDQDTALDETFGTINFNTGASYIGMEATTTNDDSDLIATDIARLNNATMNVRGTNLGGSSTQENEFRIGDATNQTNFIATMVGGSGAAATQNISIVPWAIGQSTGGALADTHMGNSLLTYVAGSGFRPLDLVTEYDTIALAAATDNARQSLAADLTGLAGTTVNALVLDNAAFAGLDVTGTGVGQSLAITSGALLFTVSGGAASTAYDTTLGGFDSGITVGASGEYVIHVVNPSSAANTSLLTATISSPLTSVADITKSGRGTLILTGTNTAGGGARRTTINEGTLEIADLNNIGGNTGGLVLAGGILRLGAGFADDLSTRTISVLEAGGTIDTNGINVALATNGISGVGSLTKAGAGTMTLSTANTHTGGTNVNAGTIAYGAANVLADTGAVNVNGGTLDMATFNDTVGAVTLTSGTIAGSSGVLSGSSYTLQSGAVSAILGGPGALTKNTSGTAVLSGVNTYTGATTVSAGTLQVGAAGSINNTSAVQVDNGGTLNFLGNHTHGTASTGQITVLGGGTLSLQDGTINTLTLAGTSGTNLTLGDCIGQASALLFDINALLNTVDQIAVGQNLVLNDLGSTVSLNTIAGSILADGTYTLATYLATSTLDGPFTFTNGAVSQIAGGGKSYSLFATDTALQLIVGDYALAAGAPLYFKGALDGTWSSQLGASTNFVNGATGVDAFTLPDATRDVYVSADVAANLAMTLGQDFSIQGLIFTGTGTAAAAGVSITGNQLTVGVNGITVEAGGGVNTINSNVALSGNQTWVNNSGNGNALNVNSSIVSLGSNNLTFDGTDPISTGASTILTGSGTVTKDGTNTVTLAGANFYTGATTINDGTLAVPQGIFGAGAPITLADAPTAVLLAGGTITRNIIGLGVGDENVNLNGTLRASSNLTVGSAGTVFQFNGTIDTQGHTVTIVTAEPTFDAFTSGGKGYLAAGPFSIRSVTMEDGATLTSNSTLYFADIVNDTQEGYTGVIFHDGTGTVTISGNIFGGTNGGNTTFFKGSGGTTNVTGIVYGLFNSDGEVVNYLGADQSGFSPGSTNTNAGGVVNAPTIAINSADQIGTRTLLANSPRQDFVAGDGYTTRINYTQTALPLVVNNGSSITGVVTLTDDQPAVNGSYTVAAGDTFYILRTDAHLWPSTGTKGIVDGVVTGTLPTIVVGGGIVNGGGLPLNSDIVTGTSGFIRAWFGNVTPEGSGAWKNGTGTNNWSANTAVDAGWGGVSGTVPGGTNNGPGFGKPAAAGQIATFNNTVLNYAGGAVNQDVSGLTIGGMSLADSGSGGYTITGSAITLDNGGSRSPFTVSSGVHTVGTPLTVVGAGVAVTTTNATDKVSFTGGITATGTSVFTAANKTLVKDGVGTAVLAGTNAFSGGTTINGGAVEVSGSLSGTVNVAAAGTLAGGGTVSSLITLNGGTFSPGAAGANSTTAGVSALGEFNATGGLSVANGSTFKLDLQVASTGGFDNGTNDKLNVTGAITLAGTSTITLTMTGGYTPLNGDLFFIAINDGVDAITGSAANFLVPDAGGFSWTLTTTANAATGAFTGGNDIAIMAAVPEPTSLAMLMGSLGMALGLQRFRRRSSKSLS